MRWSMRGPDMAEIGCGLVAYDADDAAKIKGRGLSGYAALVLGITGPRRDGPSRGPRGRVCAVGEVSSEWANSANGRAAMRP